MNCLNYLPKPKLDDPAWALAALPEKPPKGPPKPPPNDCDDAAAVTKDDFLLWEIN